MTTQHTQYSDQLAGEGEDKGERDVRLDICGAVATLTIARPSKRNAIRLLTWQALRALVIEADRHPAVAVIVVRGEGRHFSAGNDIAALSMFPGNVAQAQLFGAAWAAAIEALDDACKPVIMAIQGVCYGSALAMSLAGDVRVAAASAAFSIPVAKLGALYLRSDYQRLVATIGMSRSKKMIYTSEVLRAEQALWIGLVDEVFLDEHFESELARVVDTILARSTFTLLRSKAMLRELGPGASGAVTRETPHSLATFAEATQCADFKEGISAFLEGRAALLGYRPSLPVENTTSIR